MHIFPNSPNKKNLYPEYMKKAAQSADVTTEQEPMDDAFNAIKDLPMFGDESTPVSGSPDAVVEITPGVSPEVTPEVAPEGIEGIEGTPVAEVVKEDAPAVEQAVEKAQTAVEEAAVAISEAVESIKGDASSVEVEVEVENDNVEDKDKGKGKGKGKKDDECKDKKDDECKDKKDDDKDEDKKDDKEDSKPDFLKKESTPDKEASSSGHLTKISELSSQTRKEVYEYWRALGMPEEWCKSLTKV